MGGSILQTIALGIALAATEAAPANDAEALFRADVLPVLVSRCLECHGAEGKGGLDLRSRDTALAGGATGPALVPGDPENSLVMARIVAGEMPPKGPLPPEEAAIIRRWIADGAYLPETPIDPFSITTDHRAGFDWWSLQPLSTAAPPDADTLPESIPGAWREHPIDRFVAARLAEAGLEPSPPADARTLLRRATYDLTGLPPTPEEADAFFAACEAETGSRERVGDTAYAALIDRLLASPRYGERWGRHWLDVVRFGESTGFEVNHLIDTAWPYRDYVIRAFNNDKPYDRFVREQLAGDALAPGDPEVEVGMTFLAAGPHDIVGNQDPVQAAVIRANSIDEMVRTTGETFLGLTIGCARCHDHKFDPVSAADYYRMYATFAGVLPADREVATDAEREARAAKVRPLEAERNELAAHREALDDRILKRARQRKAHYKAQWRHPPVDRTGTEERFESIEARFVRLVAEGRDTDPNSDRGFRIDEFEVWTAGPDARNVAAAANGGQARGASNVPGDFDGAYRADLAIDGRYGARWIAAGPELTIELDGVYAIDRVFFSSDRRNELDVSSQEAAFLCEYRIEVSADGEQWTPVADSHDRRPINEAHRNKRYLDLEAAPREVAERERLDAAIAAIERERAAVPGLPVLRVGQLVQPEAPAHVFLGGDPQRKGPEVVPASLTALEDTVPRYTLGADAPEQARRVALAEWIADPRNPLTPRVMVNRLWHYHFGTGIAATPSDFGFMGGPPSHPELLDWLAREFVEPSYAATGADPAWRLKRMHRIIMLAQTYRQAGTYAAQAAAIDADSRLLWRFPPRRLSGEELRDTLLAVAGQLDLTMGGPGFRLYSYLRDNVSTYVPLDRVGPETYRRAVYHQNARAARIDLLTDFDAPDCALPAPRRVTTTTPLQALTLMNHSFTIDMAARLAERIEREAGTGARAGIARAFVLALGRPPAQAEVEAAAPLAETYGLRALCRALFNANEFVYID